MSNKLITPDFRFRRLRRTTALRELVRETHLRMSDFILPIFIEEGVTAPVAIKSMPDVYRYPESQLAEVVKRAWSKGVRAVLLFGVSTHKDDVGSDTWNQDGLLARMIRIAKEAQPEMLVISDNCFCEYTTHGHCGVVHDHDVHNDLTLENLQKQVVLAAQAGVDMIAPSGMMDGMITAIRQALDDAGFTHIPVMSYSTKFASAFYGPFRDAVGSAGNLGAGNKYTYQMDPANSDEALWEVGLDLDEGADMIMIKPGMPYLDIVRRIKDHYGAPTFVYQVSGEYAMLKAAAARDWLNEEACVLESLLAFKRAGADGILTYYAMEAASWLKQTA